MLVFSVRSSKVEIAFNNYYVGFHYRESQSMESVFRNLMEKIVEAVFDSGTNLKELEGLRVNVHLALLRLDGERQIITRVVNKNTMAAIGYKLEINNQMICYLTQ